MSRINKSIKNIKYGFISQILMLIVSFVSRMVFINTLGIKILGLNGVFTNIISIISLAELGIGTAIIYTLYEPLNNKDYQKVNQLMNIFKRIYIGISTLIIVIGFIVQIFLSKIISNIDSIENIYLIFWLFVINSSLTYLLSYKRTILIADQKKYIDTLYQTFFFFILNFSQIILLFTTKSFVIFLILKSISIVLENYFINVRINKEYNFVYISKNSEESPKLTINEKKSLKKNIGAMFLHKVGGVLVQSTDNILISKFIGLSYVGIYANYLLITNALKLVFIILYQSLSASVGNLNINSDKKYLKKIFDLIDFGSFWISSFFAVCLFNLFNSFISIWIGDEYIFDLKIVIAIVAVFYLNCMRNSVLTFKDSLGLFWQDRYKPILEASLNLVLSIILMKYFGLIGVFWGTLISSLLSVVWIEPFILYKYGFNMSVKCYFKNYLTRSLFTICLSYLIWNINLSVEHTVSNEIISFIYKCVITVVIFNLIFVMFYFRNQHLKSIFSHMRFFRR